jgi:hypothetical protein
MNVNAWQNSSDPVAPPGKRIACTGCHDCVRCSHIPMAWLNALRARQITTDEWRELLNTLKPTPAV